MSTDPTRSKVMASVPSTDTKPELTVRRLLWQMGYRYRTHADDLPGSPDVVFRGRRKVIFVHGCFWHLHEGCPNVRLPQRRQEFWLPKLRGNRERDKRVQQQLREDEWDVLVIWECQLADHERLKDRLRAFLEG